MNDKPAIKTQNFIGNDSKAVTSIFMEFSDDTTVHGFKNMSKNSNHSILKILWLLCFLACFGYCTYSCYQLFTNFYSYPSFTKITTVSEIPTQFPMVTFCNVKILDSSNPTTQEYLQSNPDIIFEEDAKISMLRNNNLTDEMKKEMGFKLEDMLEECYFNFENCTEEDFVHFYDSYYGNCYSFNSGYYQNKTKKEILTVSSNLYSYSLSLILFTGNPSADLYNSYYSGIVVTF